jgi:hypothetical protein
VLAILILLASGNETSAHLLENGRITFMFCAFDGPPKILRLYGKGEKLFCPVMRNGKNYRNISLFFQQQDRSL